MAAWDSSTQDCCRAVDRSTPLPTLAELFAIGYIRLFTALALATANGAPSGSQNALDSLAEQREPVAAKSPEK